MQKNEIEPCPFCGSMPKSIGKINIFSKEMYQHPFPTEIKGYCILSGNHGYWTAEQWNTRPLPTQKELDEKEVEKIVASNVLWMRHSNYCEIVAKAICAKFKAPELKLPEKITYFHSKLGYPDNCVSAYNKALSDIKRINNVKE